MSKNNPITNLNILQISGEKASKTRPVSNKYKTNDDLDAIHHVCIAILNDFGKNNFVVAIL